MNRILLFLIFSIPVIFISRRSLLKFKSHGFYRFFAWECILWLFASNYKCWFTDPFSIRQIASWIVLIISAYLVIAGVFLMKKTGKAGKNRNEDTLFQFEKTTELIDTWIFKYIRHPLYSSLLFLSLGIMLKNPTVELLLVCALSTVFLYLTAVSEEQECIVFFGERYREYMKRSKMFIPYII
ncbi:MAG: methyltransferase [Bacteroidota bacterium]